MSTPSAPKKASVPPASSPTEDAYSLPPWTRGNPRPIHIVGVSANDNYSDFDFTDVFLYVKEQLQSRGGVNMEFNLDQCGNPYKKTGLPTTAPCDLALYLHSEGCRRSLTDLSSDICTQVERRCSTSTLVIFTGYTSGDEFIRAPPTRNERNVLSRDLRRLIDSTGRKYTLAGVILLRDSSKRKGSPYVFSSSLARNVSSLNLIVEAIAKKFNIPLTPLPKIEPNTASIRASTQTPTPKPAPAQSPATVPASADTHPSARVLAAPADSTQPARTTSTTDGQYDTSMGSTFRMMAELSISDNTKTPASCTHQ